MYKAFQLFCCGILLSGCGINYDGSTKHIFEGRVTDAEGNPISNVEVYTEVSDGHWSDKIGVDVTDANGNYRMIFPGADEDVVFRIMFNQKNYAPDEVRYWSSSSIYNILQNHLKDSDYLINFGETRLYPVSESVQLTIQISENISEYMVEQIAVYGLVDNNALNYNFGTPPTEFPDYGYQTFYNVAKNQVLTIKYIISSQTYEAQIPVGDEPVTYIIE